ncbi:MULTISPECIES: methyltransferase domain-containing protein [Thermomonospora]|uniref:Ubiquinone/menaquinone biosynthesis C-methylase UbiE n=1 Tax=Thermomonospora cellulosilytica TaxID=1411118 RepID=A0A7W3MYZ8_9ACTN|nr:MULTISPECIES: methyltransferase domain-containing protein [Thermomonospora]MBA9004417.1 ubiquinone/menaquinone biosynthesis C-methylase UbiE [Thermomonospora cellulosilytica]
MTEREDPAASPFAQVDRIPPEIRAKLIGALDQMAADPRIRRVREVARRDLAPRPGDRLLDVGCGAGEEARRLAGMVAPAGEVTAVDLSAEAIAVAAQRHDGSAVRYAVADVGALPFPDGSFDGVRTERVLQHVSDPDRAVAELARVARPGGRLCLVDTDWESVAVDGLPDDLVADVKAALAADERMRHASMGRTLRRRLLRAGMTEVTCEPVAFSFTGAADAATIVPLFNPDIPPEAGMLRGELHDRWLTAVAEADARGELLAVLTMWVAAGRKPG